MCKSKMTRSPFMGFVSAAALLGLLAAWNPEAGLAQTCNPGMGGSIGISGPYASPLDFYIHVGQSATILQLATIDTGSCTLTNVKAWLVYPDSSFQEILDLNQQASPNNTLVSLAAVSCPGDGRCLAFSPTYQVKAGDVGNSLAFTTNWPPSFIFNVSAAGSPNTVQFQLAGSASAIRTGGGIAQEQPTTGLIVLQPCVSITKQCDGGPFLYGQPIAFTGIIMNCSVPQVTPSDGDLFILSVADDPAATITFATTTSSGRTYDGKLTAGETIVYSGSYVPQTNLCGPFSDTVQVIAADLTGYTVTNSASTVCSIITAPCISVTKNCPVQPIAYGTTSYPVSGVVSNCGNVPLVGVTVVDDNGTPTNAADDITISIGSLPIGGSAPWQATDTVPVGCGPFTDTVVASGQDICTGTNVNFSASCTTVVSTAPCIAVTKTCPVQPIAYGTTSYPVSGVVSNCGNVPLVGVTVVDDNGTPANAADDITITIGSLPIGGSAPWQATNTVPVGCGPFTDTVVASGNDACSGAPVPSIPASCTTVVFTAPSIDVVKVCPPNPVQPGGLMVVTGTVTNTGNVTLTNVVVTNSISALGISRQVLGPISLAPGAGASFSDSYLVPLDSCGPYADTFTAHGADQCFGVIVTDSDTKACPGTNTPSIDVVKVCPPNPVQPGGLMVVTGTVTNTGNVTLTNVVVTNSISALSVSRRVLGPISLAPGAGTSFSDSYLVPLDSCGPYADTFTARGADKCFGVIVTDFDTKACAGTNSPRIEVTKNCPAVPTAPGQITTISGVVSNAGNVTLTNVIVVDDQPSHNTVLLGPITLIPGQAVNFSNSYRLPPNSCTCVDTVIASGSDQCFGKTVTDSASAVCPNATDPRISVTKICPPLPVPLGEPLVFSGIVSNAGNITLTNVIVVNNQPSNNTHVFGPVTLAPGETASFIGAYVVPIDICTNMLEDTVTARGYNLCNGATVSASQSALCPIVPTPRLVVTKNCPVDPVPPGGWLFYSGTVSNAGNITLTNVIVVNNRPTNNTPVLGPITLAPNQSTNFSGSYRVCPECCPPYVDTITAAGAQICDGSNVTATATAYCPGITTPRLSLTVNCPPDPASQGQLLIYSGTVSNAGNVALGDIIVTDDKAAGFVTEILWLAPGETEEFVGFFVPTNCGPNLITLVSATAFDVCTGGSVSNQVSASCLVICPTNQPPILINPAVHTNVFTFSFGTERGKTYTVQYTDSLSPVNWQTLTSFIGDGSVATITDAVASNQQRFYRVLVQQ